MTDDDWMAEALALARAAAARGEVPVGAIVVLRRRDRRPRRQRADRRAAIRRRTPRSRRCARRRATLRNYRLPGCALYVTLEPCAMCAGAILHARIARAGVRRARSEDGRVRLGDRPVRRAAPQSPHARHRRCCGEACGELLDAVFRRPALAQAVLRLIAALQFTIVAPAGLRDAIPHAVDRAVERLEALRASRRRAIRRARSRWQRFSAPDDERLAAIARVARRSARRRRDDAARRLRLDAAARPDRFRRARERAASAGWATFDFTAFQLAALAHGGHGDVRRPDGERRFRRGGRRRPFTLDQCFGVLDNDAWEVECALDGPPTSRRSAARCGAATSPWSRTWSGTPYLPDVDGGILFLEDVGEHPYRVERMLYQLLHAGILARQRAILLGDFTEYAAERQRRRLRSGGSGCADRAARARCRSTPACRSATCPTS